MGSAVWATFVHRRGVMWVFLKPPPLSHRRDDAGSLFKMLSGAVAASADGVPYQYRETILEYLLRFLCAPERGARPWHANGEVLRWVISSHAVIGVGRSRITSVSRWRHRTSISGVLTDGMIGGSLRSSLPPALGRWTLRSTCFRLQRSLWRARRPRASRRHRRRPSLRAPRGCNLGHARRRMRCRARLLKTGRSHPGPWRGRGERRDSLRSLWRARARARAPASTTGRCAGCLIAACPKQSICNITVHVGFLA